jgi:hypothetical protein
MYVSSSVRYDLVNDNKKSDHLTYTGSTPISTEKFKPSGRRIELGFTNQGCAIDIRGTRNGNEDRGEASVMLFNLIANNYSDFIRQLIWEVTEDQSLSENRISLIHLASYGEVGPSGSDKSEIFIATKATKYSAVETGNKGLPNEFLRVLIKMSKNERLIMKSTGKNGFGVKVLNYLDKQPTTEFLIKEYNKSLSV